MQQRHAQLHTGTIPAQYRYALLTHHPMFDLRPHNDNCSATHRSGLLPVCAAIVLACVLFYLPMGSAVAAQKTEQQQTQVVNINVSAAQAARAARHEYGGKVLSVILAANDDTPYYQVKLLSSGQVRVVHVTAHQ